MYYLNNSLISYFTIPRIRDFFSLPHLQVRVQSVDNVPLYELTDVRLSYFDEMQNKVYLTHSVSANIGEANYSSGSTDHLAISTHRTFETALHSKLKTGVKSTRKSRVETLRRLAEPVLATSGSQPRVRWETGIPILTL